MDWNMPIMNGLEAAKRIKKLSEERKLCKMPLICALTGHTSDEFKDKALNNGMQCFLVKPYTYKDIDKVMTMCS
jgi:CheY-like chemotaxis protein